MKKMKQAKGIATIMLASILISSMRLPVEAATKIQSWNLVDSSKHLDWGGSTKYSARFNAAVNTWNAYKSGVIRKATSASTRDVLVGDYNQVTGTAGLTSSAGGMIFNMFIMDKLLLKERRNVCTHELGHALGLAHNVSKNVMYEKVTSLRALSPDDKSSYDFAYKQYSNY